jgi:hypothetical protein
LHSKLCCPYHELLTNKWGFVFALSGKRQQEQKFKEAAGKNKNRANHFQIFPTILELFGFSPAEIKDTYYVTLFDRVPERQGFTSGAIFGRFNKSPKWTPCLKISPAAVMRISRTIAHHGACSCSIPAITV